MAWATREREQKKKHGEPWRIRGNRWSDLSAAVKDDAREVGGWALGESAQRWAQARTR